MLLLNRVTTLCEGIAAGYRGTAAFLVISFFLIKKNIFVMAVSFISTGALYIHVTVLHRNRFPLNNQPDALIIQIYSVIKTLHVSGIFFAHHQEFSTVHSALVSFMQVLMTASKQSQDGTQY
jgi:hypothetical protein